MIIVSLTRKMSMFGKQNKGLTGQTRRRPYGKVVNCHDHIEITTCNSTDSDATVPAHAKHTADWQTGHVEKAPGLKIPMKI